MIHVTGRVVNGAVQFYEDEVMNTGLRELEGHDVEIIVNSIRLRSKPQNRYYWGVLILRITEHLIESGFQGSDIGSNGPITRNDVHRVLKNTFALTDVYDPITQSVIGSEPISTTQMSTKRFKQYIDDIRQWAAENLQLDIPDPSHLYDSAHV